MQTDYKLRKNFLIDSSDTGRFIISSKRTGRTYYIEPQGDAHIEWGSVDVSSGKMNVKKGWKKNKGSTEREDSFITTENGFENITTLKAGESPLVYIQRLDDSYPEIN
jgi:hypothetical protein